MNKKDDRKKMYKNNKPSIFERASARAYYNIPQPPCIARVHSVDIIIRCCWYITYTTFRGITGNRMTGKPDFGFCILMSAYRF